MGESALKDLRTRRGWSQRDLAKRAAVSPGRIGQMETEETPNPSMRTAYRIAGALEVGVEMVFPRRDVFRSYQMGHPGTGSLAVGTEIRQGGEADE